MSLKRKVDTENQRETWLQIGTYVRLNKFS